MCNNSHACFFTNFACGLFGLTLNGKPLTAPPSHRKEIKLYSREKLVKMLTLFASNLATFFFSVFCQIEHKKIKHIWPRGYKTFFVLNSVEHEILNAHKYKNIKKFGIFKAQLSLECYFSRSYMLKCQQLLAF